MRYKTKRKKKRIITIPAFEGLNLLQIADYKDKHRPDGCEKCEEYPCYSNDNCWTWFCHNCRLNQWRNDG